jgi:hypothetical protein
MFGVIQFVDFQDKQIKFIFNPLFVQEIFLSGGWGIAFKKFKSDIV